MKNKITVKIQRKNYSFVSDETQEYTDKLTSILDRRINEQLKKSDSISPIDAAYLTAFECMDELIKANNNIENIRTQIKDYVDESTKARGSEQKLRAELEESQRKISLLREKYAELYNEYKNLTSALRSDKKAAQQQRENAHKAQQSNASKSQNTATHNTSENYVGMKNYDPKSDKGEQ